MADRSGFDRGMSASTKATHRLLNAMTERCRCSFGRGRRPNFYTIVATLFLVMLAVQRRANNNPVLHRLQQENSNQRHQYSVSTWWPKRTRNVNEHEGRSEKPVIGVFLVINVDDVDDQEWNHTLDVTRSQVKNKKAQLALGRRATAYTVSVAVLTFKVIQGR